MLAEYIPTWWIMVKGVPEGNVVYEETHIGRRRLMGLVDRYTEYGENYTIEIGLD